MSWQEELLLLVDHDETITPAEILSYAELNCDSDLHAQFIWDNSVAGQRYRLDQARTLLRRVKITITTSENPPREVKVRAYSHVPSNGRNTYAPTIRVLERSSEELLAQALAELEALERKYENLLTWSAVIAAHTERMKSKVA
jgi:hypothetical protein